MMRSTTVTILLLLAMQPTSSFSFSSSRGPLFSSRNLELRQKNKAYYEYPPRTRSGILHAAKQDKEDDTQDPISNINKAGQVKEMVDDKLIGFQSDMRAQEESSSSGETSSTTSTSSSSSSSSDKSITESLQMTRTKAQIQSALQTAQTFFSKIFNGNFGKRGETFLFCQIFLIYSIGIGHVPLLKNFIQVLFGPILLAGGLAITFSSVQEMYSQKSFTAFATPVSAEKGGTLVNTGIHKFIRHPVYAGNLAAMIGWGVMSNSAMRLLLTFGYYLVVERKVKREEEEMKKEFGKGQDQSYEDYMVHVPDRFIPFKSINDVLDKFVRNRQGNVPIVDGVEILEKQKEDVHEKKLDALLNGDQENKAKSEKNGAVESKSRNGNSNLKSGKRNGLFP
jgi:protein-S-isoprenylcysteine O-methyltransferase Ste14